MFKNEAVSLSSQVIEYVDSAVGKLAPTKLTSSPVCGSDVAVF